MFPNPIGSNLAPVKASETDCIEQVECSRIQNCLASLNLYFQELILQTHPILCAKFIHQIQQHPFSHQLLKFSSNQHWSHLHESLSQILQKHTSLHGNKPNQDNQINHENRLFQQNQDNNTLSFDSDLSQLGHKFRNNVLGILIKISQIIGWTWIPKLRMENIQLYDKEQRYFIEAFSLMTNLALKNPDTQKKYPFLTKGNPSYTLMKEITENTNQTKSGVICFTLRQSDLEDIYERTTEKLFDLMVKMLQYFMHQNSRGFLTYLRQEMNKKVLQIEDKKDKCYKNTMTRKQFWIRNKAKELSSSCQCSQKNDLELDYDFLIVQFISWILYQRESSDSQNKDKPPSDLMAQKVLSQTADSSFVDCGLVKFMVLISIQQVLRERESNNIAINETTLTILTRICIKYVKNVISKIRQNLNPAIQQLNSQINHYLQDQSLHTQWLQKINEQNQKDNNRQNRQTKNQIIQKIVKQMMNTQLRMGNHNLQVERTDQLAIKRQENSLHEDFHNIQIEESHSKETFNTKQQLITSQQLQSQVKGQQFQCLQQSLQQNQIQQFQQIEQLSNPKLNIKENDRKIEQKRQKIKDSIQKLIYCIFRDVQCLKNDGYSLEKPQEEIKKKQNQKENKRSKRSYISHEHLSLVDDILLFNYVKLCSQLHHTIANFSKNKPSQQQRQKSKHLQEEQIDIDKKQQIKMKEPIETTTKKSFIQNNQQISLEYSLNNPLSKSNQKQQQLFSDQLEGSFEDLLNQSQQNPLFALINHEVTVQELIQQVNHISPTNNERSYQILIDQFSIDKINLDKKCSNQMIDCCDSATRQGVQKELNNLYKNINKENITVISIIGPQSSAKSTLLNFLFHSNFQSFKMQKRFLSYQRNKIIIQKIQLDNYSLMLIDTEVRLKNLRIFHKSQIQSTHFVLNFYKQFLAKQLTNTEQKEQQIKPIARKQEIELEQIKQIDSSFSHLSQSQSQKSFTQIQSSFSDLNGSIRVNQVCEEQEKQTYQADPEQQVEALTPLEYSQLNKAFLMSKNHISFDTINLSQQRQININEINIDPKRLDLNEPQNQQSHDVVLRFLETQQNRELLRNQFFEQISRSGQEGRLLKYEMETKQFNLENVYKTVNPISLEENGNIFLHIKYTVHLSQFIQEILSQLSQTKHKSLQKTYNIIRFIEISLLVHLRTQLILKIDQQVMSTFTQKEYKWKYLHGRNQNPKWQECQRKITKTREIAFGKIKSYVDNIPKLKLYPKYEKDHPNVAKAERLLQKYPQLMKLIFYINSTELDQAKFDIGLVQRLYYWITKLIKEEYLNELFFQKGFKRICAKYDLPALEVSEILNPVNLKIIVSKNQNVRAALNELMIFTIEQTKIWNIIASINYYSYETEIENFQNKQMKRKSQYPTNIKEIFRNLDLFYIYKFQRINTQYLQGKKDQNLKEFYKTVQVFLNMAEITTEFFESKEKKKQFFIVQQDKNKQTKRVKHIQKSKVGILDNTQTQSIINPCIQSVYAQNGSNKQKNKFSLGKQFIQNMKKAVSIVKNTKL